MAHGPEFFCIYYPPTIKVRYRCLHLEIRTSKMYDLPNRGTVDVKWRVLEFGHLLSSAVKCRGLPQQEKLLGKPLSSRLRIAKLRAQVARKHAVRSGLWQSALKFRLLPVAFCATVILFVAILRLNLSTELSKRLSSSSRHFTSRVPLFEASSLFAARLLEYKIPTHRIV
jgi:hypothetical protein